MFVFLPRGREAFDSEMRLVLLGLAEAMDPLGTSKMRLKLSHRNKGKPINAHRRALLGRGAASDVEKLVSLGVKQEAAIAEVSAETQLSRAELFKWLGSNRRWTARGDKGG